MSKANKKESKDSIKSKNFLVITKYPTNYRIFDIRSNKPVCYKDPSKEDASMVLQEIDSVSINHSGKNVHINYFAPNNVGILLSISNKSMNAAKQIYAETLFNQQSVEAAKKNINKKEEIVTNSQVVYSYIEMIQTCIVFGYTALEAFTNLSIPDDYEYKTKTNNKGIIETYDKEAIERWTTLKSKISEMLVDIYKTKNIKLNLFHNFSEPSFPAHQKTCNI
jgi:hypothetical protein